MLRKILLAVLVTFFLGAGVELRQARAQAPANSSSTNKSTTAYRLDFSIIEMEDGKKINSRQYSMNILPDGSNEVKIGMRVPVQSGQDSWQYLDVGTNIWSRLDDHDGQLNLVARADISNFAPPDEALLHDARGRPVIRQLKIDSSTVAVLGKPMVLGTVDDPASKRQFQLEVTVSRLK
jgi:hypothetical protein